MQTNEKILSERIKVEMGKTQQQVDTLKEATKPIAPENSIGRISRMDAINNKSVSEAALRSAEKKLTRLKMAIHKINDHDFGKCAICDNEIAEARLMFLPESNRCIRCADRR